MGSVPLTVLSTTAPFGFEFDVPLLMGAYRELGCRSCQFYRNEENPPTVETALKAIGSVGMTFDSIHGVFGYTIDPSSPDPEHRRHCLGVYEREGNLAKALGGPMVVVHPSAWTPQRRELSRAEARSAEDSRLPALDDFMRRLAEIGERQGVTYLIENQPWNCYVGHDPARLAERVLAVKSKRMRMCFDTGHAHITGDISQWLRGSAAAIDYLHVHDNNARDDDHRMPGDGTIDWPAFATALQDTNLKAIRMLEVFYSLERVRALAHAGYARDLARYVGLLSGQPV